MPVHKFIDHHGIERSMGNNPGALKMKWNEYGDTETSPTTPPLIPEDEWKDRIDALNMAELDVYGLPPTHDQDGKGQCNADATSAFFEYLRNVEGAEYVPLSAGDIYGRINGGADNGSLLEDAMAEMILRGIGTVKSYGGDIWQPGNPGCSAAERAQYRMLSTSGTPEVYICPTPAHVMSASLMGFGGVIGILWYPNFTPDSKGRLPVNGVGSPGGHALFKFPGASYVINGKNITYYVPLQNSWTARWTKWMGRCWLPINHLSGPIGGHWVGRASVLQDQNPLPRPAVV